MPSKIIAVMLLAYLFLVTFRVGPVFGNTTIKVGVYQNYPLTFIGEDGSANGFFYRYP